MSIWILIQSFRMFRGGRSTLLGDDSLCPIKAVIHHQWAGIL